MAKVSNKRTTSRKTAGSVSSNSKKNSKGLFGKSFNLQSRKVQFFVVIAIVALLGGGWFTYRSFASTDIIAWGTNDLRCMFDNPDLCTKVKEPQKNNTEVFRLQAKGGRIRGPQYYSTAGILTHDVWINHGVPVNGRYHYDLERGKRYDYCVTGKGSGQLFVYTNTSNGYIGGGHQNHNNLTFNDTTKYVEKCIALVVQHDSSLNQYVPRRGYTLCSQRASNAANRILNLCTISLSAPHAYTTPEPQTKTDVRVSRISVRESVPIPGIKK